ncbi:MAG TPA: RNA polymerase sigma factor [Pseudobacteroides sp.]|uniref:RNA polymerase sigma factor n=1 Tax=Pseudobacteroides sp. TaxID=1968840 RepID=UPI002F9537EB
MTGKLETLLESDYERFYSIAFRMTGNHHDTQDILQNSFMKAFKNIDKFRGGSKLSTWIYRIIINESNQFFSRINALPITCITNREGITEEVFFERLKTLPSFDDELIVDEMREKCLRSE